MVRFAGVQCQLQCFVTVSVTDGTFAESGPAVTTDRTVSYSIGARGLFVVTSAGGAHGRTPELLPSSRRRNAEQAQPAKYPMPIWCADWRSWALVYTGLAAPTAGRQQPAAVGAVTDTDTGTSDSAAQRGTDTLHQPGLFEPLSSRKSIRILPVLVRSPVRCTLRTLGAHRWRVVRVAHAVPSGHTRSRSPFDALPEGGQPAQRAEPHRLNRRRRDDDHRALLA